MCRFVMLARGIGGEIAELFCGSDVNFTALIGGDHRLITGEGGGNAQFLLLPINIGDGVSWRRFNESAQPHAWSKDKSRIARRVSSRPRAEGAQDRAITTIAPDSKIGQSHLRKSVAKFVNWCDDWMDFGH